MSWEDVLKTSKIQQFHDHFNEWVDIQRDLQKDWPDEGKMTSEDIDDLMEDILNNAPDRGRGVQQYNRNEVWAELDDAYRKIRIEKRRSELPKEPTFDLPKAQSAFAEVVTHVKWRFRDQGLLPIAMRQMEKLDNKLASVKNNFDMDSWIENFKMNVVTNFGNDYFETRDLDNWLKSNGFRK